MKHGLVEAIEAALALADGKRADELLASVETGPPGLRPPFLEAQANRFRARLGGTDEAAVAGFEAAAARFRELDIPFWLAVTQLEHAEWLTDAGKPGEAEPLFAEARAVFERLEASPWLDRASRTAAPAREPETVPGRS